MAKLGEEIKKLRRAKGWTQKQLGEKCGMVDSAIRKYELGIMNPKIVNLKRIADALEVPVEVLVRSALAINAERDGGEENEK